MLAGFYTVASGILTQQRNINVIGSNLTNSQTAGYRAQRVITTEFEKEYLTRLENGEYVDLGDTGSPCVLIDTVDTDVQYQSLKETESPYDMALVGDGYFNVQGEDNLYMTRNGNFNIDEEGYLVLDGIGRVMGESGELRIGGSDFVVTQEGYVFDSNNQYVDKLLVTNPAEGSDIQKRPNGFFTCDNVETVDEIDVYQKTLERSNVDMNQEYTNLIAAQRAFQACSTALSTVDNMNAKAATLSSIT